MAEQLTGRHLSESTCQVILAVEIEELLASLDHSLDVCQHCSDHRLTWLNIGVVQVIKTCNPQFLTNLQHYCDLFALVFVLQHCDFDSVGGRPEYELLKEVLRVSPNDSIV